MISFALNNIIFVCTLVLLAVVFVQFHKCKRARVDAQSYRTLNKVLMSNQKSLQLKLLELHRAIENDAGGVKRRIVENLQLTSTLQKQEPELLINHPELIQSLEANQLFFEALYDVAWVDSDNWNCDQIFKVRNSSDRRVFFNIRKQIVQAQKLAGAATH